MLQRMLANIGWYLRPDGLFVGLTIPPLLTDGPFDADMLRSLRNAEIGAWGLNGYEGEVLGTMPDGFGFRVLARVEIPKDNTSKGVESEVYKITAKAVDAAVAGTQMLSKLGWLDFTAKKELMRKHSELALESLMSGVHRHTCLMYQEIREHGPDSTAETTHEIG